MVYLVVLYTMVYGKLCSRRRVILTLILCRMMKTPSYSLYLKVWSTVKIRETRVPQNAIVPVGRSRPYSIIIVNMRFIPKASLRASSQITASSYILEPFVLALSWALLCKQTDCITVCISKQVCIKTFV